MRLQQTHNIFVFSKLLLLIIRERGRKAKYPKLEKIVAKRIRARAKFGLYRTIPAIQSLARDVAAELGYTDFKASRNWMKRFLRRCQLKAHKATTFKQQTVYSFLACWHSWIVSVRNLAKTIGIVQNGYINSHHVWNADEFALEGAVDKKLLHITNLNSTMVNTQQLLMGQSPYKRFCTVTAIVPKSGFAIDADC